MSKSVETPWKPATSTIRSWSSASWMRRARTSTIFARPWTVSVTIPACEPVSEAHEVVRRVPHRREHRDDAVASGLRLDQPAGDARDLLGVGDRGAAELHHERAGARLGGREVGERLELRRRHGESVPTFPGG